jgi:hypothetical protein
MKELMIHVERIVRPVRADASKFRMRRELLAHLQATFDQERATGLDETAALEAAKRRFGEPIDLTHQLQAAVPRWERLSVTPFPKFFTVGIAIIAMLLPPAVALALVPTGLASRYAGLFEGITAMAPWTARLTIAAGIFVMELSLWLWYVSVVGVFRSPIPWPRVIGAAIVAFAIHYASMSIIALALTGSARPADPTGDFVGQFLIILFYVAGGVGTAMAKRPIKEWLELDISDPQTS